MPTITSVHLDDELASKLDALAASMDRPKAWLIEQAVRSYVEVQLWQVQAIREAMEDYRSGKAELAQHEKVMERLRARIKVVQFLIDRGLLHRAGDFPRPP
jgi:RHH-type transcriptional regulator, rel operon repressor / antitoxin RelB